MASRPRSWADTRFSIASLVADAPQSFDLLAERPSSDTHTVIRLIGDLTVQYSPNSTIVDSYSRVDVGIGVTSIEAFAVLGTAMPNPSNTPAEYPPRGWLYIHTLPVSQQAESVGVINNVARFVFDVKAMRKIDKGILFLTVEQNNIIVGGSMRMVGRVRALCLD